jgi:hypothetical protein
MHEEYTSGQPAVINDPDGFVNVRQAPDARSQIVTKIQRDEFFLCRPDQSDWWHVCDSFGNKGFMHSDRITLTKNLSEDEVDRLLLNPKYAEGDELVGISELYLNRNPDGLVAGDLMIPGANALHANESRTAFIYLDCYMDGPHHTILFSKDARSSLSDALEVHRSDKLNSGVATQEEVQRGWSKLAAACSKVPYRHFKTLQGLALGDDIEKVMGIFGAYYDKSSVDGLDLYRWGFAGRVNYQDKILNAGVFEDSQRAEWFERCISQKKRIVLKEDEWSRLRTKLKEGDSELVGDLPIMATKGPRVIGDYGFYVTAFVRDGKLSALEYVQGVP